MFEARDARNDNVNSALALASSLEHCIGPRGMSTMLVGMGKAEAEGIVITNDGARITDLLDVQSPAARLLAETAKTQHDEVGDGTKTAVVLAGYLLLNAIRLLELGLQPSLVLRGYQLAHDKAMQVADELAVEDGQEEAILKSIALTAIQGKGVALGEEGHALADVAVEAVGHATREGDGKRRVERDSIDVQAFSLKSLADSRLIRGVMVKPAYGEEKLNSNVPRRMENARIALLNCPLEVEKTRIRHEMVISVPSRLSDLYRVQDEAVKEIADTISATGANVLLSGRRIDPSPQYRLGRNGIMVARNISQSDIVRIAKATGARVCSAWRDIKSDDLGKACLVEWRKLIEGGQPWLFVEGCDDPKASTVLALGSSVQVREALVNAVNAIAAVVEDGRYVGGGGAFEMALSLRLRHFADNIGTRDGFAVETFAESLESIPKALACNSGMSWLETSTALRAMHADGGEWAGIDCVKRRIVDVRNMGILDPFRVKMQALSSASEAALAILRVDKIFASRAKANSNVVTRTGATPRNPRPA